MRSINYTDVEKIHQAAELYARSEDVNGLLEQDMGGAHLGSGLFSDVFTWGPDKAIKFCGDSRDGAVLYLYWARANQHLPGVPRVYEIVHHTAQDTGATVIAVVMHRYAWTVRDRRASQYKHYKGVLYVHVQRTLSTGLDCGELTREHIEYNLRLHGAMGLGTAYEWDELIDELVTLGSTLEALREYFGDRCDWDLHYENIMLDHDGELVYTDPMSFLRGGEADAESTSEVYSAVRDTHGRITDRHFEGEGR